MDVFITFMVVVTAAAILDVAGCIAWTIVDAINDYRMEHDISLDWRDDNNEHKEC